MSLEEQVSKSMEDGAKIVISNVENDECTTADNDIQFEIPLVGV